MNDATSILCGYNDILFIYESRQTNDLFFSTSLDFEYSDKCIDFTVKSFILLLNVIIFKTLSIFLNILTTFWAFNRHVKCLIYIRFVSS